jgi:hypothetical protein
MVANWTQEELMAYHHLLELSCRHLQAMLQELEERKRRADESSARRAQLSASRNHSSMRTSAPQPRHRSRVRMLLGDSHRGTTKSLESDFMTIDTAGNIIPKTQKPRYSRSRRTYSPHNL